MSPERLDKLISSQGTLSRSDASKLIRSGAVSVGGKTVKSPSFKADPERDEIRVGSELFVYKKHVYIMMNKPDGIVSASRDNRETTVVDIVPDELKRSGLFPAGRLDRDTTGFMIITDDGEFAHNILSPSRHVEKAYLAKTSEEIGEQFISEIRNGMTLKDEAFLPAGIELKENGENPVYEITLHEGKYHQIKRMIAASGAELVSLKRIRMGALRLDETLGEGECREMTAEEVGRVIL